jgi:hypothetical protein
VDGVEQGNWVCRNLRGARFEGCFVDGRKHGQWLEEFSNGDRAVGEFAMGNKNGPWRITEVDGTSWVTMFQDGKMVNDCQVRENGSHDAHPLRR